MIVKKICMLGGWGVGKTSLVSNFVHSIFSEKYQITLGVKIDKKTVSSKKLKALWCTLDDDGPTHEKTRRDSTLQHRRGPAPSRCAEKHHPMFMRVAASTKRCLEVSQEGTTKRKGARRCTSPTLRPHGEPGVAPRVGRLDRSSLLFLSMLVRCSRAAKGSDGPRATCRLAEALSPLSSVALGRTRL